MIIDLILDRSDDDKDIVNGISKRYYNPSQFYSDVLGYCGNCGGYFAEQITRAMDYGTNTDVQRELNRYIAECGYNTQICNYVNSRNWIEEENEGNYIYPILDF